MTIVTIDLSAITDWESFHFVFAGRLGFPDFYGRNMNAWIDCMTSLDCPEDGLTSVHVQPGQVLVLQLEAVAELRQKHPEQYAALIECSAFVNWRRLQVGEPAVLALSFFS